MKTLNPKGLECDEMNYSNHARKTPPQTWLLKPDARLGNDGDSFEEDKMPVDREKIRGFDEESE